MNVFRCTIIDQSGGCSFVVDVAALPALLSACARNPSTLDELLIYTEPHYSGLRERVLNGLAVFDERNTPESHEAIRQAIAFCKPHELPPFRVVDDQTRDVSLQPVKAGAILFNLRRRRIVQLQNSAQQMIRRKGQGRVYDGSTLTRRGFRYALPDDWAIVP